MKIERDLRRVSCSLYSTVLCICRSISNPVEFIGGSVRRRDTLEEIGQTILSGPRHPFNDSDIRGGAPPPDGSSRRVHGLRERTISDEDGDGAIRYTCSIHSCAVAHTPEDQRMEPPAKPKVIFIDDELDFADSLVAKFSDLYEAQGFVSADEALKFNRRKRRGGRRRP
jgi:hypothetical protein